MGSRERCEQMLTQGAPLPPKGVVLTPEQAAARGKRNIAIALSLLAFVILIFFVTYVHLMGNMEIRLRNESVPPPLIDESPAS